MRLLLDAHLSPHVAERLAAEGINAVSLRDWRGGNYHHASDDQILLVAAAEECVLVTYDARSIQPLVKEWAETGRRHAGVIVIDAKTIQQGDIGGQIRALRALARDADEQDWHDLLGFLRLGSPV